MEKIKEFAASAARRIKEKRFPDLLESVAKYLIYLWAALVPLWFLPVAIGIDFGREIIFSFLILAAVILTLAVSLIKGEIRFSHSPLLYFGGAMLILWTLSTIFGRAPLLATVLNDVLAERLTTLLLGLILMAVLPSVFKSKREAGVFLLVLICSGGIAALGTLLQLFFGFSVWGFLAEFADSSSFNVIGTTNGLSIFYGALFVMTTAILFSLPWRQWRAWVLWSLVAAEVFFGLTLLLLNYRLSWISLVGAGAFLFGLMFLRRDRSDGESGGGERRYTFGRHHFAVTALLALSIFMLMFQPVFMDLGFPPEVSPSFSATWDISKSVFKEGLGGLFFGSGPSTFGLLWDQYKDTAVNQTPLWNVRFNQGYSSVATSLATTGILGALGLVLFLLAGLFFFTKTMVLSSSSGARWRNEEVFSASALVGFLVLAIDAFVYPANFTLILVLFALAGLLNLLLAKEKVPIEGPFMEGAESISISREAVRFGDKFLGFWKNAGRRVSVIEERSIILKSQWAIFLYSLTVVFLLSLALSAFYYEAERLRGALLADQAIEFRDSGDLSGAADKLERAISIDRRNAAYHKNLVEIRTEIVRNLIQRASAGEDVRQEFQAEIDRAGEVIGQALELHPNEPLLWRTRGGLYETIVPFLSGSEFLAAESYRRATELGPLNPASYVDFGRAGLVFVDTLSVRANQVSASERQNFEGLRRQSLDEVVRMLSRAIEVKPDFAPAHFLLSQAAIRAGDLGAAIRSTEQAKLTAPFDVGIAFQLGLLYYQAGDLDRAEPEFARAISQNDNYSNARYFLGLIYDQKGDGVRALEQFMKVQVLNPGNNEVRQIIENLNEGRGALEGIVPPGTPPEERSGPPVETEQ